MAASDRALQVHMFPALQDNYCYLIRDPATGAAAAVDTPEVAAIERARDVARLRRSNRPTIPTTMGLEKATNPFLRTDSPAMREKLGMGDAPAVEVFAETRRRRDRF